jgi:hypothetical protein
MHLFIGHQPLPPTHKEAFTTETPKTTADESLKTRQKQEKKIKTEKWPTCTRQVEPRARSTCHNKVLTLKILAELSKKIYFQHASTMN